MKTARCVTPANDTGIIFCFVVFSSLCYRLVLALELVSVAHELVR
jgi:hypothetical protein